MATKTVGRQAVSTREEVISQLIPADVLRNLDAAQRRGVVTNKRERVLADSIRNRVR